VFRLLRFGLLLFVLLDPTINANDRYLVLIRAGLLALHGCLAVQGELPDAGQSHPIAALEAFAGELPSDVSRKIVTEWPDPKFSTESKSSLALAS
jgi:hypothetical protein